MIIDNKAIIICGPTASGKTDIAHKLALELNGEIVNCDSVQIYKQIPIITASPSSKLKEEAPYHLYNFLDVSSEYSVAEYIEDAVKIIREISSRNRLPIIVGGSGMYINSLIYGMNEIPNISKETRLATRELFQKLGNEEFFQKLSEVDPQSAIKLRKSDSQRIIRAYEVMLETGKSIFDFHLGEKTKPLPEFKFEIRLIIPERAILYENCNERVSILLESGAIEEVRHLLHISAQLGHTAKKALGISEIMNYLDGKITYENAIELIQTRTRQYAKRQTTWFKNQL